MLPVLLAEKIVRRDDFPAPPMNDANANQH